MRNYAAVAACLFGMFLLPSCGGAVGNTVRPDDHTAQSATGTKAPTCTGDPKYAKPFIVDLDPDDRVGLEASMKKGAVVVAYDCSSFRVLSSCKISDSAYEYAGVQSKEQVIQMTSADDLHANIPINSAKLGAELTSGRSIDLAIVMVGRRTTPVTSVNKNDLTGACDGATHYVQTATLGAFSMATGSVGKVGAVAEMFSYGGGAKSESERKAMNKDGNLDECRKSDPNDASPPNQCGTPIRVELMPIAGAAAVVKGDKDAKGKKDEEKKEAAAVENPCPEGFTLSNEVCVRASSQVAHLCKANDEADCRAQCDKGSQESCYNLGTIVWKAKSKGAAMPFFKKACDGGFADGCAELGNAMYPVDEHADAEAAATLAVLNKACDMGSGRGCDLAGDLLQDKDYKTLDLKAAVKRYARGCDLGYGTSCSSLADMFFKGRGLPQDNKKGVAMLALGCQGGGADECAELASSYAKGTHDLTADKDSAYKYMRRACELDVMYCVDGAQYANAASKDAEAVKLAAHGCKGDDWESCLLLGDYYKKGRGVEADEAKAKTAWGQACKDGKGDEDACKRLGIKMKD
ncbi:MAG: tetratricopeptide repeat protein [Polyangiaceae bacterium]